jgi:two-component system, OmpR family, phosphate regulon sensor histidine kinase PhoR
MSHDAMKNRGIFQRIFILYAVVMLLAILVVELYITAAMREYHIARLRDNLAVQAALIADHVSFHASSPLDNVCKQLKEKTGARITVIGLDGRVLGDSDTPSPDMDNHAHRQEIQQALLNNSGMAVRFSDTIRYDFLYVARKIAVNGEPVGFVRLSVPLRDIDRSINIITMKVLTIVISILLATGLISLWQIDHIRRLTRQIRDFSRSLAHGELGKKLFIEHAGEYDEIAESLNTMSAELQKNIAASEEEKYRLNMILRNIPDALFIIDVHGVIILSSLAARKLFGETALQGRRFIEVFRNSEFLTLMEDVQKQRATGVAEVKIDSPLEQYCVVQVSPLSYNEAGLSGYIAIFHDITRLKKLEQTRKDFVANISHEIKTPITVIQGFAETLLEGALDDTDHARKFLKTIRSNSERINSLVDDLMTISKLELGVISITKTPVDLEDVGGQIMEMLQDKAKEKNLTIKMELLPVPKTIEADRDRLIQILTNLVENAIKFTEQGGVTFGNAQENGLTYLYVEDTGIGIAQKYLPRLGERFYRVDPGRSRNMGGTGLGLAIVKHLVKAHGWDLQIESSLGKGTKIKVLVKQS